VPFPLQVADLDLPVYWPLALQIGEAEVVSLGGGGGYRNVDGQRQWRSVQVALSTTEMSVSSYHRLRDERSYRTKVNMQTVSGDWRLLNFLAGLPGGREDEDAAEQERRLDTLWDSAIAGESWSVEQMKIDDLAYDVDVLVLSGHTLVWSLPLRTYRPPTSHHRGDPDPS
jgi:hypothetical protein